MRRIFATSRFRMAILLIFISAALIFVGMPGTPALAADISPLQSSGACGHVLRQANATSGPEVECFVNATTTLTFEPNQLTVPANATVIFSVGNIGTLIHTFTLDSVANDSVLANWTAAPSAVSGSALSAYFANHTAVNLNITAAGPYVSAPVTLSKAHGIYYYVCLEPSHFQSGMFGELYEGISAPAVTVLPAITAPIQTAILAAAFLLLAVAALLILNAQTGGILAAVDNFSKKFEEKGKKADPNSLRSWLFTTDHKKIGILYLVTAIYFLFLAGSFALLMRTQTSVPSNTFVSAAVYNQLVSLHGLLMALFVISPLGFAFANYIIPLQIGARDMSFPRLNALSYWLFLFGGVLMLSGIFLPGGAISSGWTIYAPLNETEYLPQAGMDTAVLGILMLVGSVVLSTVNIGVTVARQRAKGYKLMDMPMFVWSILFTMAMAWVAFPDLAAALSLLAMDRTLGSMIFLSDIGGSLLWQNVFWFFGHPEVYILIFPAFGAMYDIASVFAGRPIYGKRYVIYSMAAIAGLSMMVWLHHMFMSGASLAWLDIQSITTGAISIPSDTMVLGLMFTVMDGRARYKAPMLFTMGGIPLFIIGGLSGVFLSVPALDVAFHGSYFVIAHFHYMLAGTALWGLTAATYYWFPKMTGKMYSEKIAKVHLVLAAIGINVLYFPMFFLYNMPRRYYTYSANWGFNQLNFIASFGAYIYGAAQVVFLINLVYSLRKGQKATRNPWGAWGFEWLTSSPPPAFNFYGNPKVDGDKLLVLPTTEELHGPEPSMWPFVVGLGTLFAFAGFVVYFYWATPILLILGLAVLVVALIGWARQDYKDHVEDTDHGLRETWPFSAFSNMELGTLIFIGGDFGFVGAMVAAYYFVSWQAPLFNSSLLSLNHFASPTLTEYMAAALVVSILTMCLALWASRTRRLILAETALIGTILLGAVFIAFSFQNWNFMNGDGMGLSTVSSSMTASLFYDYSIIHILHVAALIGVLGYFAIRLPKLMEMENVPPEERAEGHAHGSAFDGLTAATYLWIFIAAFGLVMMVMFWT